jgi:peptidoglycan-associated lipoprotein
MQRSMTGVSWLAVAAAALLTSGCATQEYVDEQIAAVNGRIESVNGQVGQIASRVDANAAGAQKAQARADEAYTLAQGKMTRTVISESDGVSFATNEWQLSDEAQATLTAFADRLKSENKNVVVEIVGRGDPRGSTYNNRILGEKRALEVRRYLMSQGIPLNHMETVSWGEEKPIAVDAASTGGDTNAAQRRVILRVTG